MRRFIIFCLITTGFLLPITPKLSKAGQDHWNGVDATVVEKFADEAGRPAREPYINTDQGDLLLFLFAISGAIGGFIMGYFWRELFGSKKTAATGAGNS